MSVKYANRVKQTTTTIGLGPYNLEGTKVGFQTFVEGIGYGNECYYCITDGKNWEIGRGTIYEELTETYISRDSVESSSEADAPINWLYNGRPKDIFASVTAAAFNTVLQVLSDGVGPAGPSAYDTAVTNGFVGTETDWLDSLIGPVGRGIEYDWNTTSLGIRYEGEVVYDFTNLQGPAGIDGINGIDGIDGVNGTNGLNLEYTWNGTSLGVRQQGEITYNFVDLKGEPGEGGGLMNFVETTAPGNQMSSVQLAVIGDATHIALVLSPKGSGALQTTLTDDLATGGAERGYQAIDLQTYRTTASMIAGGVRAVISGGGKNEAGGSYGSILGGLSNIVNGDYSAICGGFSNEVLGIYSAVVGGRNNIAAGGRTIIGGGESNYNAGAYSVIGGGNQNETTGQFSAIVGGELNLINSSAPHGFIGGGKNNTVTHQQSSVVGGENNVASGQASVVLSGVSNTASTSYCMVLGGTGTNASGLYSLASGYFSNASGNYSLALGNRAQASGINSVVLGGVSNYAYGMESAIIGGNFGSTRNTRGMVTCGTGYFATGSRAGNAQKGTYVLGRETTDGSPLELLTYVRDTTVIGESTNGTTNVVWLPDNSAYTFRASIVAQQDTGDTIAWEITGLIKRGVGAATTILVGTPAVTELGKDAGAATWTIAVTADTTIGALMFTATGEAAKTIHWVASVDTTQVTF